MFHPDTLYTLILYIVDQLTRLQNIHIFFFLFFFFFFFFFDKFQDDILFRLPPKDVCVKIRNMSSDVFIFSRTQFKSKTQLLLYGQFNKKKLFTKLFLKCRSELMKKTCLNVTISHLFRSVGYPQVSTFAPLKVGSGG